MLEQGRRYLQPIYRLLVIWAIGISMIFLAIMIYLPYRVILGFGLCVLLLQSLMDNISFPDGSAMATFWAFFYKGGEGVLFGKLYVSFLYPYSPILDWFH